MKKNKLLFLFLLSSISVFCQQIPRTVLHGQIVADSMSVENVNVTNMSLGKVSISDKEGFFNIYARENDTIVFSSISFESKKIILTAREFKVHVLRVRLDPHINQLDEVVINPDALTGSLEKDHKNIKVFKMPEIDMRVALETRFEDDEKTSPQNKIMPGFRDNRYMMDFMALGNKVAKLIKGKTKPKPVVFISEKIFPEAVRERISDDFFIKTLQLQPDEIGLFLNYCENEPNCRQLLDPKKEFELINFLIRKSVEYKSSK